MAPSAATRVPYDDDDGDNDDEEEKEEEEKEEEEKEEEDSTTHTPVLFAGKMYSSQAKTLVLILAACV